MYLRRLGLQRKQYKTEVTRLHVNAARIKIDNRNERGELATPPYARDRFIVIGQLSVVVLNETKFRIQLGMFSF
jgi:hypothetical protein